MKIELTSVMVGDQAKALAFYTDVLGFVVKLDLPMGEFRFITLVSPEAPDGAQLMLEPNEFPPAQIFQKALYEAGIPATAFRVEDIQKEHDRLTALGVAFTTVPTPMGEQVVASFDDTCGNLIQIYQH